MSITAKPFFENRGYKVIKGQQVERQGIFRADAVRELIEKQEKSNKIVYSSLLWSFYIFQMWYSEYIAEL